MDLQSAFAPRSLFSLLFHFSALRSPLSFFRVPSPSDAQYNTSDAHLRPIVGTWEGAGGVGVAGSLTLGPTNTNRKHALDQP